MLNSTLNQSLWLDEATSILTAKNLSFIQIITKFSPGDFHPPLYYFVLKMWISIFGSSEISARMLSIVFAIGTVCLVYRIGSKLFSKNVGLWAAFFLATAPLHFYYMLEARMYSMETFLTASVVWCFVNKKWFHFTAVGTLLAYTDYLPLLVFIPLLLSIQNRDLLKKLLLCVLVIGLALLPWLPIFYKQLQVGLLVKDSGSNWWMVLGKTNLKELTLIPTKFLVGRISSYDKVFYATSVFIASLPAVSLLIRTFRRFEETKLLWLWLVIPITISGVVGIKLSVFSYFRLLFTLPALYLLIAYGMFAIKKSKVRLLLGFSVIFVNLVSISIYVLNPRFHREDWRNAVSWVESTAPQNSASVFVTNNQRDPYLYYSKNITSYGPSGFDNAEFEKIYLFRYVQPIFDPEDNTRKRVESLGYKKTTEKDFNGITIWEYIKI